MTPLSPTRNPPHRAALAAAVVAAVIGADCLYVRQHLGFPDGHRTAYELALTPLLTAQIGASFAAAAALVTLVLTRVRGTDLALVSGLYLSVTAGVVVTGMLTLPGLDDGRGG